LARRKINKAIYYSLKRIALTNKRSVAAVTISLIAQIEILKRGGVGRNIEDSQGPKKGISSHTQWTNQLLRPPHSQNFLRFFVTVSITQCPT